MAEFKYIHRDEEISFVEHDRKRIMYSIERNGKVEVTPIGYIRNPASYRCGRIWGNNIVSVVEPISDIDQSTLAQLAQDVPRGQSELVVKPALKPKDFAAYEKSWNDYQARPKQNAA